MTRPIERETSSQVWPSSGEIITTNFKKKYTCTDACNVMSYTSNDPRLTSFTQNFKASENNSKQVHLQKCRFWKSASWKFDTQCDTIVETVLFLKKKKTFQFWSFLFELAWGAYPTLRPTLQGATSSVHPCIVNYIRSKSLSLLNKIARLLTQERAARPPAVWSLYDLAMLTRTKEPGRAMVFKHSDCFV